MKPTPTHLTNCPNCHGTGKVELEGALKETLSRFSPKGRLSANDLHDPSTGKTKNATNNRLEKLRTLGLLDRAREGRVWTYFRTNGTATPAETAAPEAKPSSAKPLAGLRKADLKGRDGAAAESAKRAKVNAARSPKKGAKTKS